MKREAEQLRDDSNNEGTGKTIFKGERFQSMICNRRKMVKVMAVDKTLALKLPEKCSLLWRSNKKI